MVRTYVIWKCVIGDSVREQLTCLIRYSLLFNVFQLTVIQVLKTYSVQ